MKLTVEKGLTMQSLMMQLVLIAVLVMLSGCTKNQDDIELPIYDAVGGDFTLPSTAGTELTLSDYQGRVVLLNFGYTSCPDICPMVLSRLAQVSNKLTHQYGIDSSRVQTIFVSVDPDRDSIDRLREYLVFFNPDFIGIRGSISQTNELTKSYAVFFEKQADPSMGYQVAHTDKIFLLDKRGRLRGLYNKAEPDTKLINDIVSLVAAEI